MGLIFLTHMIMPLLIVCGYNISLLSMKMAKIGPLDNFHYTNICLGTLTFQLYIPVAIVAVVIGVIDVYRFLNLKYLNHQLCLSGFGSLLEL